MCVPSEIQALVENGKELNIQREKREKKEFEVRQQEWREQWDVLDGGVRNVLPKVLRPYMKDLAKKNCEVLREPQVNKSFFTVVFDIPGLAPIQSEVWLDDGTWQMERRGKHGTLPLYLISKVDVSGYDNEYFYSFRWSQDATDDLDVALANARAVFLEYERQVEAHRRIKVEDELRYEALGEDGQPADNTVEELLIEGLRSVVREEIEQAAARA